MRRSPDRLGGVRRARRAAAAASLGLAGAAAAAAPARAQAVAGDAPVAVDVGLARIQQAGTAPLVAPSVGASWRARSALGALGAAAVAAAGDGRVAAQLALDGARAFGPAGAPREVTAELRAVRVPNTPWAAQLLAGVRQQVALGGVARRGGAWAGVQGGVVRQVGEAWPSGAAEAGAWWRVGAAGRAAVTATGATARVQERGLVAAGLNAFGPARVRTGDVVASFARAAGRVELGAWAGARAYAPGTLRALPPDADDPRLPGAPLRLRGIAAASATAWLWPVAGVTASAGALPNDPVRGLPAARHLSLALRVRPGAARRVGSAVGPASGAAVAGPSLAVDGDGPAPNGSAGGGSAGTGAPPARVLRVDAPGARRVWLRADATAWRAVELARDPEGGWAAALPLASGTHRVLVRVDDGPWRAPANLPAVDDDLGGRVGLLVVP
jgi:hypothetical protein